MNETRKILDVEIEGVSVEVYLANERYINSHFNAEGSEQVLGAYDGSTASLFLWNKIPKGRIFNIVVHEVTHAVIDLKGVHFDTEDREESICDFVAGSIDTIRDVAGAIFSSYNKEHL